MKFIISWVVWLENYWTVTHYTFLFQIVYLRMHVKSLFSFLGVVYKAIVTPTGMSQTPETANNSNS